MNAEPCPRWRRLLIGRNPHRTLVRTLVLAFVCFVVFRFVLRPVWVDGDSMDPTLRSGTLQLVNLQEFRFRPPRLGEVVVIEIAGRRLMYCKRLLALPGDRFSLSNGVLIVNGRIQPEPYVRRPGHWTTREYELGPDEYYVAGDNREGPIEQHATGIVERHRLAGRVLMWPPGQTPPDP